MAKIQPNSQHCFVCGVSNPIGLRLRFQESGAGQVIAECTLREDYQGYPGIAHGGVVAAMLDEISARAYMGSEDKPRFMYTARLEIRYRKHVPIGKPLRLVGYTGVDKGRAASASGEIYDQQGTLLAECKTLLVEVPSEVFAETDMQELGWQVYT